MTIERAVLVTGAASGIGAATALALAAPGTALMLTTRGNADGLAATAERARASGAAVSTRLADLTKDDAAAGLVDAMRGAFGRVDQIVSNAGRAAKGRFGDFDAADLAQAMAVNTAPFLALVTAALDDLQASDWGRVVAVSSFVANDYGINGTLFPTTAAAKAALEALMKSLAMQVARTGLTVNCVAPGFTRKIGGHAALDDAAWARAAEATPSGKSLSRTTSPPRSRSCCRARPPT